MLPPNETVETCVFLCDEGSQTCLWPRVELSILVPLAALRVRGMDSQL
jgi:hypothetical protein